MNELERIILGEARGIFKLQDRIEEESSPVLKRMQERRFSTLRRRLKEDVEEWKQDRGYNECQSERG